MITPRERRCSERKTERKTRSGREKEVSVYFIR